MVSFIVPGRPVPKKRPRLNSTTGHFYTPRDAGYEDSIAWASSDKGVLKENVIVNLVFYMPDKKPADLDNLVKSALDGIQKGGLVQNDSQVVVISAEIRQDKVAPRTIVSVEPAYEQGMVYCHGRHVRVVEEAGHKTCEGCGAALDRLVW